ncbi:protein smg8 isoform X2 [Strongylocentrotus purpuratus]|uniref:Nonsense-mediated mRNA decay factor SMG8 n=1 Tax=Strongylocentrotus purpuratus TaxID=7668 RepID=A0A7M7NW10_STRPU|nr:protein smg8 isoform X2 [Strongylocentrotus purpuratus]
MEKDGLQFLNRLRSLNGSSENVCVIGVFGKGSSGSQCNGLILNNLLDKHIFEKYTVFEHVKSEEQVVRSCYIEPYYDKSRHTLYLQLVSIYDGAQLAQLCRLLPQHISTADSHAYWKSHEGQHARLLLYLFTISHIMMVCHPRAVFDTSYVKLFRALQTTREKLSPQLSSSLKGLSVSRQWQTSGRMCTPRLLFVSQQSDLNDVKDTGQGGQTKKSQRKALQHHLEDQIYRIFRKTHILTNNMSHCLFSIPLNQAFVHILHSHDQLKDTIHELINSCSLTSSSDISDNHQSEKEVFVMPITMETIPSLTDKPDDSLRAFVHQHVDLILNKKGFDDTLRGAAIAHFEYPSMKTWIEVATSSYQLLMNVTDDPKVTSALTYLQTALDQDLRFSEMRCKKILPMASRSYQENASSHYTSTVHRNKLLQAMKMYSQHARGPAYETFADQLQEECELFWQSGRQLCEVISLTGHHCIHKLHLLPSDPELDPPREIVLSHLPHTNNNQTPCACNCGRSVGTREDPFDVKVANYDFFKEMEEKCCSKLHHYEFTVYSPAPARRPSQLTSEGDSIPVNEGVSDQEDEGRTKAVEKIKLSTDTKESQSGVMTPELSLGQSVPNEGSTDQPVIGTAATLSTQDEQPDLEEDKEKEEDTDEDDAGVSEPHYNRPLEGMLCSITPRGMLPSFSSWSLVCLGPSSLYNPTKGLDHPNFMRDSKHLLAWDIPIPKGSVMDAVWPSPSEMVTTSSKKGGRGRDKKDGSSDGLRAYIGNEYECPRGHRFICSGPDKVVKVASGSGGPKESANKLVTLDMPLYYSCPCRANKPPLGQLIRSFIVTPPKPVHIKLNPKVRPGPHPTPVFTPLPGDEGITLTPSSMWVLRYPFVYGSEAGPVMPPADNQPTPGAKLLKGLYLVTLQAPET